MRIIYNITAIILILILFTTTLFSQEQSNDSSDKKLKIAVIDLRAMGVSETTGSILSGTLRSKLFNLKDFEVMNRQDMQALLEEKAFQQSGICDDTECIVEMGLVLGVEKVVSGSIGKLGETFSVTLKLVDVETAKNEVIVNRTEKCDEDYLFVLIKELADELTSYENDEASVIKDKKVVVKKKEYDVKTTKMINKLTKKSNQRKKLDISLMGGIPYSGLKLKWYVWRGLFLASAIGGGERENTSFSEYEYDSSINYSKYFISETENEFTPNFEMSLFQAGLGYRVFNYWNLDFELFAEIGLHKEEHKITVDLFENIGNNLIGYCDYVVETSGAVTNIGLTIDRTFKYNIHVGLDIGYSFSDDMNYEVIEANYQENITDIQKNLIIEAAEDLEDNLIFRSVLIRLDLGWRF